MDKRTILFVILVSVTFFGANLYFSHNREQQERAYQKERELQTAKKNEALSKEVEKKKVPLEQLPIIEIQANKEGTQKIAYGINVGGNTLTLAWAKPMPENVYVKGVEQKLVTCDAVLDGPALYAPKDFTQLPIASLPEKGSFDLQLISFPANSSPVATYAEYKEGTLKLPLGPIKQNGIALFKNEKGYLPVGFYEWRGNLFITIQNLPLLACLPLEIQEKEKKGAEGKESFYLLQNDYFQILFSSVGGSVAEINLPFRSDENQNSVVKEIGFDREIISESPANAHFPSHPYITSGSSEEHPQGQVGGYYPLLRRGVIGKKTTPMPPEYYAFNTISEYAEMALLPFEMKEFTQDKIVFEATQPHRKITKTYTLSKAPYSLDLAIKIEGDSRGLSLTSGIPDVEIISNSFVPQIQYALTRKEKLDVEKVDLPKASESVTMSSINPNWVVNSNGFLGLILTPLDDSKGGFSTRAIPGAQVPTRLSAINTTLYPVNKYPGYELLFPLPVQSTTTHFRIYAGPFEEKTLKAVDAFYTDPKTGVNPDYSASWTFYGWFSFISEPFAKFLFIVMKFFYTLTCSWAAAIFLLTLFLRVLLYPLNSWSFKSMRRMKEISPQVQAIQKKYKKDPKKGQMEIMALYRQEKVNPMSGCLPIVIQIPFLIAMFDLLKSSFQLRGASFIPGWIDDLTAPDVIFSWKQPIFFIGNELHLLPFILGAVMLLQQHVSSPKPKDRPLTDQERQQRGMGTMMSVAFTLMFYNFPSGLNLYWLFSMLLGIGQQWFTNRWAEKKTESAKQDHIKK